MTRPALLIAAAASILAHAGLAIGLWLAPGPAGVPASIGADSIDSATTLLTLTPPPPKPAPPEPAVEPPPAPEPAQPPEPAPPPPPTTSTSAVSLPDPAPAPAAPEPTPEPRERPAPAAASSTPNPGSRAPDAPPPPVGVVFAGASAARVGSVVYCVDASGAMASSFSIVLDELRRSVSALAHRQRFNVVLFRGGSAATLSFAPALVEYTPESRRALERFLADARPAGRSDPLAGLAPALGLQPDALFFLSRSIRRSGPDARWGEGTPATLERLESLNPRDALGRRRTSITTIQLIEPDPTGLMQAIAERHGEGPASAVVVRLAE